MKAKAKKIQVIRRNDDGSLDDIAITGDLFRLEQMDDSSWWCCIYRGKKRTAFNIYRPRGKNTVVVEISDDSIGCIDDRKKTTTNL